MKIKINWGTGVVIAFAFFISFIMYFIIKVQTNSEFDNELVVEEYYKHDANFGDEMAKIQNAEDLSQKPIISQNSEGVFIVFPTQFDVKKIKGKVVMYRPSNKKFDFEVPLSNTSDTVIIPKSKFIMGVWDISIEWEYENEKYISKETIYFK
ncbi:MAG TPA: FixH family protein [Flavobacterium sp.]|nr:FixH family protein [Flavobacterium sp.]